MNQGCFEILIVGAGRGGTSLLAGILDAHPQLEIAFEQFSADYLMGRALSPESARNYFKRVEAFRNACDQAAKQFPNSIWGNKITTEQLRALQKHNSIEGNNKIDILQQFFGESFRDKKTIFILRDGRACSLSKTNRTGIDLVQACTRWQFSAKVYRYLNEHRGNWHIVKYEDLVSNPSYTVADVCDFLEIEYAEDMLLKGTDNPKMLQEYRQQSIVEKRQVSALPENCLQLIKEDLIYCGYL